MTRWVLITRTPADCSDLQRMLSDSDIRLRPFPVLRVEDVTDDKGWTTAVAAAATDGAWLVLASPRAPERLVRQAHDREAAALLRLPVAVVGGGTERAASESGLEPRLVGPGTGAGLATELGALMRPEAPVIFACGHHRRPEIPTKLEAARLYLDGVGGHPLPCPHIALGPTTRDAAAGLGIDCRTPSSPDLESLAEELCRT